MRFSIVAGVITVLAILISASVPARAEENPWRCILNVSYEGGGGEGFSAVCILDLRTGESEELASFPDFYLWSAAADETWRTVVVAGYDLKADGHFICYRLAGPGSTHGAEEAEVILESSGPRLPHGDVIYDASEGVFYVGAEGVGTNAGGEKYRETILFRYEPAGGAPVELARLGRHVFLGGEYEYDRIYVLYDDNTSYGRRRVYGYVDKKTFDVVPLGILPDYFGGEPAQYVPYGSPEGPGQLVPGAPATIPGPRAYAEDTAKAEAATERRIFLRDPASPGGYRAVKVDGTPGRIFYSPSHDVFVYVVYPANAEGAAHIVVTYRDGTSAEPVRVSILEVGAGDTSTPYDYGLLYVE
jgi:hypothetical protein